MDDATTARERARAITPPGWSWPLLVAGPAYAWYGAVSAELARVPDAGPAFASPALAWAGVAALVASLAAETLFYGMLWAARGTRLPLAPCALALLPISTLELLAASLARHAPAAGLARTACVALAGARVLGAGEGGFACAFGSFGLVALVRMALWAWVQADAAGRRWRDAAPMVAAVWLASHVALGWIVELVRGRSGS